MEAIPAKMTPRLINEIDEIVQDGLYSNRSEFIRDAVRDMVRKMKTERLEQAIKEDISWGLYGED
jgi:putative addiction module CopG family antidote